MVVKRKSSIAIYVNEILLQNAAMQGVGVLERKERNRKLKKQRVCVLFPFHDKAAVDFVKMLYGKAQKTKKPRMLKANVST